MLQDGLSTPRSTPCVPGLHAPLANSKFNFQTATTRRREKESWIASSLSLPAMTARDESTFICVHVPAARCARGLHHLSPSWKVEGAGKAGCALHPRSRVQNAYRKRTRAYRFSGGNPAFPARWFTAYFALSPVTGLFCHRRQRNYLPPPWHQRRGVRTTRLRRPLQCRSSMAHPRPPHPVPRS
jgi:hypothetical protein